MTGDSTSRRHFVKVSIGMQAALAFGAAPPVLAQARPLAPTPPCGDDVRPTPRQTAGPYFKPGSPQRTSLVEPGMPGSRIVVSGRVVWTDCRPVARALVDVWHADDRGDYDNGGYRLRGHLFTDDDGRYRLETIVPGVYPGRTRHFHVNVQAPNRPVLTTQLYFPNDPGNARDGIFSPALLLKLDGTGDARQGAFDFVLRPS